jgi:DNA-binding LacI/PurR family transcriptional regulator
MPATTKTPKYQRLADTLRRRMREGELKAGDRLPSFVQMHREHGATVATMRRVYELLENERLIERRSGSGVYVADGKSTFTGNIGLIGRNLACYGLANYYHELLEGIEQFTAQKNQHVLSLGNYTDPDRGAYEKVDGVLMLNVEYQRHRLKYLPPAFPRVSLLVKENDVANAVADEQGGARQAVQYLMRLGHRRIACLLEKHLSIPRQRLIGHREALSEAGIDVQPEWMRLTEVLKPPDYLVWGRDTMKAWLQDNWLGTGCTAILVQNDAAASGVMQMLQEAGIEVPGDVSVIGFDGTEFCEHISPSLCSMKIPLAEIGYKGAEILYRQIYQGQRDIQTIMLPMGLREGDSVAPLR